MVLVAVQLSVPGLYLPPVFKSPHRHDRPRRSFHCQSRLPCDVRPAGALVVLVAVQLLVLGLYLPPVFDSHRRHHESAPDDHFSCRSRLPCEISADRRIGRAGGCPTIGAGIVSAAGVQIAAHRYIHPRRSFHCRSRLPCDRLVRRAHWWCWWPSNYPCWDCISRRCSKSRCRSYPPQTIISLPVQTAV